MDLNKIYTCMHVWSWDSFNSFLNLLALSLQEFTYGNYENLGYVHIYESVYHCQLLPLLSYNIRLT